MIRGRSPPSGVTGGEAPGESSRVGGWAPSAARLDDPRQPRGGKISPPRRGHDRVDDDERQRQRGLDRPSADRLRRPQRRARRSRRCSRTCPAYWVEHIQQTALQGPDRQLLPAHAPDDGAAGQHARPDGPPARASSCCASRCSTRSASSIAILNCPYAIDSLHNPDAAVALAQRRQRLADRRVARQGAAPARLDRRAESRSRAWPRARSSASATTPASSRCCCRSAPSTRYGNRLYHPIWEAIARHDLVAGIHFGGAPGNPPTPSGWPSYYFEEYVGMAQVFAIPAHQHRSARASSTSSRRCASRCSRPASPGCRRTCGASTRSGATCAGWCPGSSAPPSEYIREHVRLTIQPLDAPAEPAPAAAGRRPARLGRHAAVRQRLSRTGTSPTPRTALLPAPARPALARQDPRPRTPRARVYRLVTPSEGDTTDDRRERQPMVATSPSRDPRRTRPALIDCDFHNELDSIKDLYPYLSKRWRDHIETLRRCAVQPAATTRASWITARTPGRPPGRAPAPRSPSRAQNFLDPYNVAYAMLIPLDAGRPPAEPRARRRAGARPSTTGRSPSGSTPSRACAPRSPSRSRTRRGRRRDRAARPATSASSRC